MPVLLLSLLLLAASCKKIVPEPRYCAQDVSGVWVNASDPAFAYRLSDHGDVVRGKFFHRATDGGEAAEADEDPLLIELHRTPAALAGTMRTTAETASGKRCPVEFALRVSSCSPGALQIVAETSVPLREDCTRARAEDGGEALPQLAEYRWERPPSPDGASAR